MTSLKVLNNFIQFERQKKNFELELSGLDAAINTFLDKLKKRETQYNNSVEQLKKQKDEVKNIQKSIDPKLTKKLASTLDKKPHQSIRDMANAFVGLLEN